jgi:energy-coupling factor transport system ATP-binding protein
MLARLPEALAEVGLQGFERRRSIRLSGGEQQRLALAGVLAPRPGLLILDEPTANLDPEGAAHLFDEIAALKAGGRATLVLIEHQADLAWPLADRVLALASDGSPLAFGSPAGVLSEHGEALRSAGIWLPDDDPAARIARAAGPSDTGQPVVEAADVSFAFDRGQPVVSRASITISRGDRAAIMGRNGSGKSTLGRLLVGLLRPTTGTVRLGGGDPARLPTDDLARRAGYAFQDPERQFLAATVRDEVTIGLRPAETDAVDELMAQLGLPLDRFADRSPYRLSGGEQRRLSLACMLARRPDLLVLDEPTFGQDRQGHDALLTILRERVDAGSAVLAMTHDRRFVASFADRVLEMRDGRPEPLRS